MGPSLGLQIDFDNDCDVERLAELLVEALHLVNAGFDRVGGGRFLEVCVRQMAVVQLVTVFAVWSMAAVGAIIR